MLRQLNLLALPAAAARSIVVEAAYFRISSMTLAVCIKCGSTKHGALNPCDTCGLRPETETEVAYSMAFSDHHWSRDALDLMSQSVREGGSLPSLSNEQEQQFIGAIREPLVQFASMLRLRPEARHFKFIFDQTRLSQAPWQPAPYPTFNYLGEFAALGERLDNKPVGPRVNLVFQTPDNVEFALSNVDWGWTERAWAVTLLTPLGTITCHLNFSTPLVAAMQARTVHEIVHIYRARGLFHQAEWTRLVGLADQLGVMELSIKDFLRAAGHPTSDIPSAATLGHFYASEYQNRVLLQELMEQDAVAHLVELSHCGLYTPRDLASIQDVLDGISTAEIAKRPGKPGGRSLMGVLTRAEPVN